ncbi:MAG TPA: hypothetical protein PKA53_09395 [Sphingobacterium sp.]|nr:hypothetical protein [Sphingobacterium sp.]
MPIPFSEDQVKLANDEKGRDFKLTLFKIPFRTYLGKDRSDKRVLLQRASLSVEHPITVSVDKDHYQIGNKEEFLYRRMAIQSARQRIQKAAAFNRGGYGRKKKLKSLEQYSEKEKRYVDSRLHLYSRKLIDICIKSQVGTLLLVNQTNKEEVAKEDEFLLRNWSYYGLIEKIKYKANMAGINLIVG